MMVATLARLGYSSEVSYSEHNRRISDLERQIIVLTERHNIMATNQAAFDALLAQLNTAVSGIATDVGQLATSIQTLTAAAANAPGVDLSAEADQVTADMASLATAATAAQSARRRRQHRPPKPSPFANLALAPPIPLKDRRGFFLSRLPSRLPRDKVGFPIQSLSYSEANNARRAGNAQYA